jgi:tetratricopeptide (TPR) repeat protein
VKRQSLFGDGDEEIPGIEAQTTTHTNSANVPVPDGAVPETVTGPKPTTPAMLMKPLAPPDSHYLNAAQGWLGLGDCQSAQDELELIDPRLRTHPDVLAVRCDIYTTAMKWPAVVAVASALVQLTPGRPSGWVRRSFALHGLKRTQQAFDLLLPAASRFPEISTIPYNLACYCAQLGKLEEARRWLQQACEVGNATILKTVARTDPDLSPLFVNGPEL